MAGPVLRRDEASACARATRWPAINSTASGAAWRTSLSCSLTSKPRAFTFAPSRMVSIHAAQPANSCCTCLAPSRSSSVISLSSGRAPASPLHASEASVLVLRSNGKPPPERPTCRCAAEAVVVYCRECRHKGRRGDGGASLFVVAAPSRSGACGSRPAATLIIPKGLRDCRCRACLRHLVLRLHGGRRRMVRHVGIANLERPAGRLPLLHGGARGTHLTQSTPSRLTTRPHAIRFSGAILGY